ncbi:ABC transporter substrate-binding protein [Phormidium tenue FACHB-886]|nr:ABC transporter substrate-binding protein [Phormidium tenue FACHB-886]
MSIHRRSFLKFSGYCGATALLTTTGMLRPSQSLAADVAPLTMQLDWKFNVQFAGLLLADYLGLYQQKGLNVTLNPWQSDMVVPEVVSEAPLTIGCSEQNLILEAQAKGAPLKAIATMFQSSPYALMALPDSGITTLRDLIGKRVGIHLDGVKVMELVKGVNGLQPEDIEIVEIPYENKLERLISGEFAALQCYAVDEPIAFAQKVGKEATLMPMDQYGYKAYAQVFFTTDRLLNQQPEQIKAFLEASFEGWQRAFADVSGTAEIIAKRYAEAGSKYTNVEYQQQSLELVKQYVMRGIAAEQLGVISPAQWQQAADMMVQYDIIGQSPVMESSLDLSLWGGNS